MENREREQLNQFLLQLRQARAGVKDAEADGLIREAVAQQPDAPYLLVQRALLLEQALQASQATIARLQAELDQNRTSSSNGFLAEGNTWGQAPTPSPRPATVPASTAPWQAAPPIPAASSWGGGSLLGTVATTAVGVVAGSFLFQGLGNLMGQHHSPSLGSAAAPAAPLQPLADAAPVNNFTDTPGGGNDLDSLSLDGDSPNDWG